VPNKFIAFSSPYDKGKDDSGVILPLFRICYSLPRTFYQFSKNSKFQLSFD